MSLSAPLNLNFNMAWPSLFFGQERSSIAPKPVSFIDASRAANWLRQFGDAFPRFERIAANGVYSLLEKEIANITPLLNEGRLIAGASSSFSFVTNMIDQLVKPRISQLQQSYANAEQRIAADTKLKENDAKLEKKWEKLGLPVSVLQQHADCARFLVDSNLIYTIIGYKESCRDANLHDLKLDVDGHPMIKLQGRFVRWQTIANQLEYDPEIDKIKSRGYSGNIVQTWSYFHPQGLVPIDRFNYDAVFPIYELSQEEYNRLITHSKKFYENNPEKDPGIAKDCVVQFFTSPRNAGFPDHPLLENLNKNLPVHIGIRLITADRKVYSFGYQMPFEEQEFILSDYFSTFLATAETKISMCDYEEFRSHEGRTVTSVPLSSQRSQNILTLLDSLKDKQLRFQFARQNCSALVHEVIQRAGYEIDTHTSVGAVLLDMFPYLNQFPVIGGLIAKIETCTKKIWAALPKLISTPLKWTWSVMTYIPVKLGTILVNLILLKMGAAKKTTPLQEGVEEEVLYPKKGIQNFSSVIRSWTDIFKDETARVSHSKFFIDWQKKQQSTFVEPSSDRPKLAILPPVA